MSGLDEVSQVGSDKQPIYYADPSLAWEVRLAQAFDKASGYLASAIPAGTPVDLNGYEALADSTGQHIDGHAQSWLSAFQANKDLDNESGISLPANEARALYLGKYAQATSNIGVYLSGHARKQVANGSFSEADFNAGAEGRLRALSEVIHLGEIGFLPAAVAGESYAAAKGATAGSSPIITIASPATYLGMNFTQGGAAQPTSGLGFTGVEIAVVVLVALLVGAGVAAAFTWSSRNFKDRQACIDMCMEAIRRGDPNSGVICKGAQDALTALANPVNQSNIGDFLGLTAMLKSVKPYLIAGAGIWVVLAFAPEIIKMLGRGKDAYSQMQAKSLHEFASERVEY